MQKQPRNCSCDSLHFDTVGFQYAVYLSTNIDYNVSVMLSIYAKLSSHILDVQGECGSKHVRN